MTQTVLCALSKYRGGFIHLLRGKNLPQCLWFSFRQDILSASSWCDYSHWQMIFMRRGLWGKVSRRNQTRQISPDIRSLNEPAASSSTTSDISGQMLCSAQETTSPQPCKRAKIEHTMPEKQGEVLRFLKISENATAPKRGSDHAAGFDLYSALDCVVPAQGVFTVMTDIKIELPEGCYGRVAPRSGLARKNFIDVGAGVIDRDYRGNVGVVMFNHSKKDFQVAKGERIAQLICEKICYPDLEEVEELSDTVRGSDGFGSTGKC